MGARPNMPDSLPVIGRAPGQPGLWLAFGHGHWGLTLGPVTGRLIADMMTGETPFTDPAPYRAERFMLVAHRSSATRCFASRARMRKPIPRLSLDCAAISVTSPELVLPARQRAGEGQRGRLVDAARDGARQHIGRERAELGKP